MQNKIIEVAYDFEQYPLYNIAYSPRMVKF